MNGEVSASMRQKGINYKINFGLDSVSLKEIARRYEPDKNLAERLWQESSREGKILATLLYPKDQFSRDDADIWLNDCFTTELIEQLCFNLLQYSIFAYDIALSWISNEDDNIKSSGCLLLLRLILSHKWSINEDQILALVDKLTVSENMKLSVNAKRIVDYFQYKS
jgi:3-methyladenine DNA glycosylase AlkD